MKAPKQAKGREGGGGRENSIENRLKQKQTEDETEEDEMEIN